MKRLHVTVNGKVYDVQVEEVSGSAPSAAAAPASVPTAPAPVPVPEAPAAIPAPASAPAAPAADAEVIASPMPGTIVDVKVSAGESVKYGDVLFVLEAMKMENDVVAPHDAVVEAIHASKGDSVETGQPVVSIR